MAKVFVFGDNVDTDVILPGEYLSLSAPADLAKVCMAGIAPGFAARISQGDIFVSGRNFGCGSSREHAPLGIRAAGVACVVAVSFARIFYRNAVNVGLPVVECPEAALDIGETDEVEVDLDDALVRNLTRGKTYRFPPFSPSIVRILRAGGLIESIAAERGRRT